MIKLDFIPNVSVGPFVFGMVRKDIWKIMQTKFGSEREHVVFDDLGDCYLYPNFQFEYCDNQLISINILDDINKRYCDVYLGEEKIWPRTERKIMSMFGRDSFTDIYSTYYHTELSMVFRWYDNPKSLLLAQKGYCTEYVESFQFFELLHVLKIGSKRQDVRRTLKKKFRVSGNGRTDCYHYGFLSPKDVTVLFDDEDRLLNVNMKFHDGTDIDLKLNR